MKVATTRAECRVQVVAEGIGRENYLIRNVAALRNFQCNVCLSLRSRRLEVVGERENECARGRHARGYLSPRVSPSRAPVFSCAYYFQAPATQAMFV